METTVKIKGMVCRRCIDTVKDIFQSQGAYVSQVKLGEVTYQDRPGFSPDKVSRLLLQEGFEILTDRQATIISRVKELIENVLLDSENQSNSLAALIQENLPVGYDTVSNLFSQTEGIQLEQYVINKRIEKVQELLKYSQLSLTDIAFRLGYSSVHHLSNQFKKITGMPPSVFRELQTAKENSV